MKKPNLFGVLILFIMGLASHSHAGQTILYKLSRGIPEFTLHAAPGSVIRVKYANGRTIEYHLGTEPIVHQVGKTTTTIIPRLLRKPLPPKFTLPKSPGRKPPKKAVKPPRKKYPSVIPQTRRPNQGKYPRGYRRVARYDALMHATMRQYPLPLKRFASAMQVESHGNPNLTSNKGATCLMQVLPSTGRAYGIYDLDQVDQCLIAGAKVLIDMKKQLGTWEWATLGYHSGLAPARALKRQYGTIAAAKQAYETKYHDRNSDYRGIMRDIGPNSWDYLRKIKLEWRRWDRLAR